jgi:hypothetical protein
MSMIGRLVAVRFQGGEHDVRPGKQRRDSVRGLEERLGSTIVGAFGQTTRTTAGMPSGSTSSTAS